MTTTPNTSVESGLNKKIKDARKGVMITTAICAVLGVITLALVNTVTIAVTQPNMQITAYGAIVFIVLLLAFVFSLQICASYAMDFVELVAKRHYTSK